jgi:haloacetate dehalogenase
MIPNAGAQSKPAPSPSDLAQELPSALPVPGPGANLNELPEPPSAATSQKLLPGFQARRIRTSGAEINVLTKGYGPPLLLIHGHPETHLTWHKIAPALAEEYTVVLPDLRGYGDSSKPGYSDDNSNYSFRAMALDQVEVMQQLGYERFLVAGHDRGGRVAHRLCLDHPSSVEKVALLDVAPTLTKEFATKYVWWFLQIQPAPMPEHLIGLDPAYYLRDHLAVQGKTPGAISPEVMAEYIRCYCCLGTIRAVCEDYRAAAGLDLEHDREDESGNKDIQAPLLALWGAKGTVGHLWDVLATWRAKSNDTVSGKSLPCGHLLPEEDPEGVLAEFREFFRA